MDFGDDRDGRRELADRRLRAPTAGRSPGGARRRSCSHSQSARGRRPRQGRTTPVRHRRCSRLFLPSFLPPGRYRAPCGACSGPVRATASRSAPTCRSSALRVRSNRPARSQPSSSAASASPSFRLWRTDLRIVAAVKAEPPPSRAFAKRRSLVALAPTSAPCPAFRKPRAPVPCMPLGGRPPRTLSHRDCATSHGDARASCCRGHPHPSLHCTLRTRGEAPP